MTPAPPNPRTCCATNDKVSQAAWQQRYIEGAIGWDRGKPSPQLHKWLADEAIEPCRILIPGCGRGHEVIALAEREFSVTGIDFADSAITYLRQEQRLRKLQFDVIQTDLFAYQPSEPFDAVYEQTCLCAIDPSQWETYEQLLCCWTKPGATLLASFMQSDASEGPPFSCDLKSMRQLFPASRWHWHDTIDRVEHPTGMHELACRLTRNSG
ncbi:MAG: methyltransferase domain-containing protein [Planctomycetales bacterium]|nr:methyltransferase domain-containing protein [Planctomycetales bacterium]